jgi:hypothetical protein
MTLSERMLGLVIAPPEPGSPSEFTPPAAVAPPPARVTVLTRPADASAAAAGVALALSRRQRRTCAVAVTWGADGEDPPPAGALPAAARLASRFQRCGLDAVAAGQLVRITLRGGADQAIGGWRIVSREELPTAFSIAGPRTEALDHVLGMTDAIVVVVPRDAPGGLVAATESDAAQIGPSVATAHVRLGAATRGLLALGYGVPPKMRTAIERALG